MLQALKTRHSQQSAANPRAFVALKQGSKEAAQFAHEIHADALRLEGEYLAGQEKNPGRPGPGRGKAGSPALPAFSETPTLAQQGITKRESAQAAKNR
jgi:hypothetical protein